MAHHQVEHDALALLGALQVGEGIQVGRALGNAGQQGGLGQREIGGGLAKVDLRGSLGAIGKTAVVEQVEIHLEDLVLGVEAGQLLGDAGLLDLAVERLVVALVGTEKEVAGELHGDGARAGDHALGAGVLQNGPGDAAEVDAAVAVEGSVLGGDGGVDEVGGNGGQAHPGAPAFGKDLGQQRAVAVVEIGGLEQPRQRAGLVFLQVGLDDGGGIGRRARADLVGGQAAGDGEGEDDEGADADIGEWLFWSTLTTAQRGYNDHNDLRAARNSCPR